MVLKRFAKKSVGNVMALEGKNVGVAWGHTIKYVIHVRGQARPSAMYAKEAE